MKKLILIALALFISACDTYPVPKVEDNAETYYNRGVGWHEKGDYDKAISDYTNAIELDPKLADAYVNRGLAYARGKGWYDRAISDSTKAIELNPRDALPYNNRGLAYKGKGQYDRAISDYNKTIELNPRDAWTYNNLSWLLSTCPDSRYRNGAKALALAQKAVELRKASFTIGALAAAYAEVGNFEEAIKAQERAISLLKINADTKELAKAREHLECYKAHKPWREPRASGGNP